VVGAAVDGGAAVVVVVAASVVVDVDVVVLVDVVNSVDVGSSRAAPSCEVGAALPPCESQAAATTARMTANAQIRLRMIDPSVPPRVVSA
jgi:hypothetical protein